MADVCRQIGISDATFYTWKKKYAEMGVSELRKLKQLEDENARLRRIVADLTLDKQILQEVVRKKDLKAVKRRERAAWMQERFKISVRHSCDLALLQRPVWYAKSTARDQSALRQRIRDIAMSRPRFGYLRVLVMLKREGWQVGKKRVYRLYALEGLHEFITMHDVHEKPRAWQDDYNHHRPHGSLGHLTPSEFATMRSGQPKEAANL